MKTYVVISDVHSNIEALEAVLSRIRRERPERTFFLGDSVGYGPDPDASIDLIRKNCDVILSGNHDCAAAGLEDISRFNPYAQEAVVWTARTITDAHTTFLKRLPLTESLPDDGLFFVHSTPRDPEQWEYLSGLSDARINFHYFDEQICFLGHSHIPFIIERDDSGRMTLHDTESVIRSSSRYIVNAGSVGQPRDGNPDAAYVLVKEDFIRIKRVPYDILLTQKKIKKAGLPEYLSDRLSMGR